MLHPPIPEMLRHPPEHPDLATHRRKALELLRVERRERLRRWLAAWRGWRGARMRPGGPAAGPDAAPVPVPRAAVLPDPVPAAAQAA